MSWKVRSNHKWSAEIDLLFKPGWGMCCGPFYLDSDIICIYHGTRHQVWDRRERCGFAWFSTEHSLYSDKKPRREAVFSLSPRTEPDLLCLTVLSLSFSRSLSAFHVFLNWLLPLCETPSSTSPDPRHISLPPQSPVKPSIAVKHQIPLPAVINTSQLQKTHNHSWECTGTHAL